MNGESTHKLAFSCTCGSMQGHISETGLAHGTHVVCFCQDCRAAQLYFGQPDPAPGPVEVFQTTPEDVIFDTGAKNLALMQFSPKGMYRWYAKCCNAPIAGTSLTPKFPFVGFIVNRIQNPSALGPIRTRGFVPGPNGKHKHEKVSYAIGGLLVRFLKSRLSGSWKKTPFFRIDTGSPVAEPTILTKEQRASLYR